MSAGPITAVGIKVELSTERGRAALLYDSTSQALPKLEAGQRHDFAVKHDVKELVSRGCCGGMNSCSVCQTDFAVKHDVKELVRDRFSSASLCCGV